MYEKKAPPHLSSPPQLYNFLRFCEMLLKASCKVKKIHLLTSQDEVGCLSHQASLGNECKAAVSSLCCRLTDTHSVRQADSGQQSGALAELRESLRAQGVTLDLQYSSTIHDREIRCFSSFATVTFEFLLLYFFIIFFTMGVLPRERSLFLTHGVCLFYQISTLASISWDFTL